MSKEQKVKLSNGEEIPIIGLGTWKSKPDEVTEAVKYAIEIGYRHIDCAMVYENEKEVGNAIREKIADGTIRRQELFVTSKLWNTYHNRTNVLEACTKSLADLGLDYIDLYLIHWPMAFQKGDEMFPKDGKGKLLMEDIDICDTWKGMEECYERSLAKSIGLANFNSEQIKRIFDNCRVKPTVLQIECHPYLNQNNLIDFCKGYDLVITAYSPLGSPDRPWSKFDDPYLMENTRVEDIAENHKKSPAQVLIRFHIERGTVTIPKSVTKENIRSNLEVFDFALSIEEMNILSSCEKKFRYCELEEAKDDSNYPFNIEY